MGGQVDGCEQRGCRAMDLLVKNAEKRLQVPSMLNTALQKQSPGRGYLLCDIANFSCSSPPQGLPCPSTHHDAVVVFSNFKLYSGFLLLHYNPSLPSVAGSHTGP